MQFNELGLQPALLQALADLGYTHPTPIQEQMIPVMLTGADVIGQAQTGTGKTAAFALPILHNLTPGDRRPQALVLAPTRELALQVAAAFRDYGQNLPVRVTAVYGGAPYGPQIRDLKRGTDVVVGTPGRLLDLLRRGVLDLGAVRTLVLDEADEMLSMGFLEDIETVLAALPAERQIALFSATMPPAIRRLAQKYQHAPQSVTIASRQRTAQNVAQRYYLVNQRDKTAALTRIFEIETPERALVFVRTRAESGELAHALSQRGFSAEMINGDLAQAARERVLERFRSGQLQVLVATDVAARGLDVDDISHVFNYDLPEDPEVFVHRIGRTGRAGKDGLAISLVTPSQRRLLRRIEAFSRQKLQPADIPSPEAIRARRRERMVERLEVWLRRKRFQNEMEIIAALEAAGHDPRDIAAAALRLVRESEKQRPIESLSPVRERPARKPRAKRFNRREKSAPRSREAGMVRLRLDKGRADGIRPGDVVGIIAGTADIPGRSLGAIRIQEDHTFVDVPEDYAERVMAHNGKYRLRRAPMKLTRAA